MYVSVDAATTSNRTVLPCEGACFMHSGMCCAIYNVLAFLAGSIIPLACGGIVANDYGELLSPGFPNDYCNNTNCSWSASFNTTKQVTLTFHVFSTAVGDQFTVHIEDPLYGDGVVDLYSISGLCLSERECPNGSEISFLATRTSLEFITDQAVSLEGFNISYRISNLSEC